MAEAGKIVDRAYEARIPRVVVALGHPTMRRYVCDLIEQGCRCWLATSAPHSDQLAETVGALCPDLIVTDSAAFAGRRDATPVLTLKRMLIIGTESDAVYRQAAFRAGAGGWVGRDDVASDLVPEICRMLEGTGCKCHKPAAAAGSQGR